MLQKVTPSNCFNLLFLVLHTYMKTQNTLEQHNDKSSDARTPPRVSPFSPERKSSKLLAVLRYTNVQYQTAIRTFWHIYCLIKSVPYFGRSNTILCYVSRIIFSYHSSKNFYGKSLSKYLYILHLHLFPISYIMHLLFIEFCISLFLLFSMIYSIV